MPACLPATAIAAPPTATRLVAPPPARGKTTTLLKTSALGPLPRCSVLEECIGICPSIGQLRPFALRNRMPAPRRASALAPQQRIGIGRWGRTKCCPGWLRRIGVPNNESCRWFALHNLALRHRSSIELDRRRVAHAIALSAPAFHNAVESQSANVFVAHTDGLIRFRGWRSQVIRISPAFY